MDSREPQTIDQLVAQLVSSSSPQPPSGPNPSPIPTATPPKPFTSPVQSPVPPTTSIPSIPPRPSVSPSISTAKIFQPPQPFRSPAPPHQVANLEPKLATPPLAVQPKPKPLTHEYESVIRTMESDLAIIKSGKGPQGSIIQKSFTPGAKTPAAPVPTPSPNNLPPIPSPEIQISSQSRTGGFISKSGIPGVQGKFDVPNKSPIKQESKIDFAIPQGSYSFFGNKQFLILGGIIIALLLAGSYWFFVWSPSPDVAVSPTPTSEPTTSEESPVLSVFDQKFGSSSSIILSRSNPDFTGSVKKATVGSSKAGEFKSYQLFDDDSNPYTFRDFLVKLGVSEEPLNLEAVSSTEWRLVTYGHYDDKANIIVRTFFVSVIDGAKINDLMSLWEQKSVFIEDMAGVLEYRNDLYENMALTADNYSSTDFKYIKLPDRNRGVSYAVFKNNYLIIASSRDSFRAAIDALASSY